MPSNQSAAAGAARRLTPAPAPPAPPSASPPPLRPGGPPKLPRSAAPVAAAPAPVAAAAAVAVPAAELAASLDKAFDALVAPAPAGPARTDAGAVVPGKSTAADIAALHATYAELAVEYCAPVRNVMIEVRWGEPPVAWLEFVRSPLASLRAMADQVGLQALAAALDHFTAAVDSALASGEPLVSAERRQLLLEAYADLPACLPRAFELEGERSRREPIILRSLLMLVPQVVPLDVEKFLAAGLTSLEAIARARPEEIAAVTGLAAPVAAEIVELMRTEGTLAAVDAAEERKRLAALVSQLAAEHLALERAAAGWSAECQTEKRRLRRQRAQTLLRIKMSLARLGDVDRVDRLERLPFSRKIEALNSAIGRGPNG
jgi:hypothetical protein